MRNLLRNIRNIHTLLYFVVPGLESIPKRKILVPSFFLLFKSQNFRNPKMNIQIWILNIIWIRRAFENTRFHFCNFNFWWGIFFNNNFFFIWIFFFFDIFKQETLSASVGWKTLFFISKTRNQQSWSSGLLSLFDFCSKIFFFERLNFSQILSF